MSEELQIMNLPDPMVNKNTTFHGNPLLKSAREQVALTKEHIEELRKCMNDPVYFAERYIKIVNIDTGLQNIKLYPYQKRLLKGLHENRQSIILSCRQSGKTTVTVCFLLWFALFNEDKEVCLLANKGAQAREIMARIQLAYTHLPKWLQSGVTSYNKSSIELENGCKIIAAATSSDAVRGRSFACVTGDTKVNIKRNEEELTINIEDIENTDLVLTQYGYKKFECVRITPKKNKVKILFSNGDELKCSLDHKLLTTSNVFVEAQTLKIGDFIKNYDEFVRITSIIYYEDYELVYDLVNVEDTHSYYTNGVLSHNCVFIDECIGGDTMITVRNKVTGEIKEVSMEDFWGLCK